MTCRKGYVVGKTAGITALTGQTVTVNCLLVTGQPALRRQELYTGFHTELGNTATTMCEKPPDLIALASS
ncbi:MAG: hypothetical protein ABIN97_04140 [Ginsengibacter sp.]